MVRVRDAKVAKLVIDANLPLSFEQIVGLEQDEFNNILTIFNMTPFQLDVCREARKRGRNNSSARKSRQKKQNIVSDLESRIIELQMRDLTLGMEVVSIKNQEDERIKELKDLFDNILFCFNVDPNVYHVVYFEGRLHIIRKMIEGFNEMDVYEHLKTKEVHTDYITFTP